jgi:hypothetical protein
VTPAPQVAALAKATTGETSSTKLVESGVLMPVVGAHAQARTGVPDTAIGMGAVYVRPALQAPPAEQAGVTPPEVE